MKDEVVLVSPNFKGQNFGHHHKKNDQLIC